MRSRKTAIRENGAKASSAIANVSYGAETMWKRGENARFAVSLECRTQHTARPSGFWTSLCGISWLTRWERRKVGRKPLWWACFFFVAASVCDCWHSVRKPEKRGLGCCTEFVVPLMRPVAPQQKASRHWYGTHPRKPAWKRRSGMGLTDSDDEEEVAPAPAAVRVNQCLRQTEYLLVALHCLSLVLV